MNFTSFEKLSKSVRGSIVNIAHGTTVLVVLLLMLLSFAERSHAQGAAGFVQGNYSTPQSSESTVTVNYTYNQLAGDLNLVVVGWVDATNHVTSVTDTKGNTYTLAVGPTVRPGAATQSIYYAKNILSATAGQNTVTVTFTGLVPFPDVRIAEYSGLDKTNPVDVVVANHAQSTNMSSGSLTTTNANDLLISANTVGAYTFESGPHFVNRMTTSDGDILQDRYVSAVGTYDSTAQQISPWDWIMQMVAFRIDSSVSAVFIQNNSSTPETPQSSVSVEYNADQLGGDLNVVIVGWNDSTAHVQSVTDAMGNTYQLATGPKVKTGALTQSIYYAKSIFPADGNQNGVTVVFDTPAVFPDIRVVEYRGMDTTNPFDVGVGNSGNSSTSSSGSVTTTYWNDLLVAANMVATATASFGSSYSGRGVTNDGDMVEDKLVTTTGSNSATASLTSSDYWVMQMAAFRTAAGAGGPTAPHITQISPSSAAIGASVTITGNNFGATKGSSTVSFNGTSATVTGWSNTSISVNVPVGVTNGNVVVTVGSQVSNGVYFSLPEPAVTFIQSNSYTWDGPVSNVDITYDLPQLQSDLNVVFIAWKGAATVQSVTDTSGNTYALAIAPTVKAGFATQAAYYAKNISAASPGNDLVINFNQNATDIDVRIAEYQGLDTTNPLEGGVGASGNSDSPDSGTFTTTHGFDLLVGADYTEVVTDNAGFLFTPRVISGSNNMLEDRSVRTAGDYDAAAFICPSGQWIMQLVVFRMAAVSSPSNQAPQVNAGSDQTITLPNSASLSGTVTDDGLPSNILSVTWSKLSGPGSVTFGNPNVASTTATFATAGTYILQLAANDSLLSTTDTMTATVNSANQAPIVSAGPNQSILLPTSSVILEGTATDDGLPSNTLSITWSKVSGPGTVAFSNVNTPLTQATFLAAGVYVLQLSANDSLATTNATTTITVNSVAPTTLTLTATRSKTVNVPAAAGPWLFSSTFNAAFPFENHGSSNPISYPVGEDEQVTFKYLSGLVSVGLQFGFYDANGIPGVTGLGHHPGKYAPTTANGGSLMGVWADASGQIVATPFIINDGVTQIAPHGAVQVQLGVNDEITYADNSGSWSIQTQAGRPGATTSSGANIKGSTQTFTVLLAQGGVPISSASVQLTVTGANPQTLSATTDATGVVSFSYTGTNAGTDAVHATSGANTSNTISIPWIMPVQNVSTSTAVGKFFPSNGSSCTFNTLPTTAPAFTQEFPTINFNPPTGTIPGNSSGVDINTRPFTDVTTDTSGNFIGTTVAEGNGFQAGISPMTDFQAVYTGTFTVASSGNVTLNFFTDRGFIFGIGGGATRVSGVLTSPPASGLTPFSNFPVLGALNNGATGGATGQTVVVNFPAAGTYQYELDYTECGGGQLTLTMGVGASSSIGMAPTSSLRITPNVSQDQTTSTSRAFTAEARDATGALVPNLGVALIVNGVNPQELTGTTNSSGVASFSYTGSVLPGYDHVQAVANINGMTTISSTTLINWIPPGGILTYVFASPGWIASPALGAVVQGQVPITLVSGINLVSGQLSYWPSSDPTQEHVLNSNTTGTGPTLGTFDASVLPNGEYTIALKSLASTGAAQLNEIVVNVMGENKPGRVTTTVTDLKVPLAGMPISISRTYDSLERFKSSDFGFGWKLSTTVDLTVDRQKNVSFKINGQRRTFFFAPKTSGSPLFGWLLLANFQPEAGLHGTLIQEGGCGDLIQIDGDIVCALGGDFIPTSYTYTDPAGRSFKMSATGQLQSIKDLNGVTLTYAANGIISSAGGAVVPFIRDSQGRITQITDLAGNHYTYSYDGSGNLASILLPATTNPATYTYVTGHLLSSQMDARGNSTSQTYDSAGRLETVTNAAGTTHYAYNIATNTTTTTFPDSGVQVEVDNSLGKPLSITDPLNHVTTYTYDDNQNMLTMTNALTQTWTYTYDANGFQTSVKDPLNHTKSTIYNQFGGPTAISDALQNTTTVTYDFLFNPLHVDDSIGQSRAFTFDASGNPLTVVDANGKTTHFVYDSRGNLMSKTDPLNHATTYTYDSMDRMLTETDPRNHTTTYAYDALGRLTSKTDALNHATIYTYDNNGNKLTEKDALNHQTSYQYDALNRVTQITYPDSTTKQYTYNFRGQKLTETDQSGRVTQYQYDLAGQLSQVTFAFGTAQAGTVQYTYDAAGRKKTVKDENNKVTTYTYDNAGHLFTTVNALNQTWTYSYDAADRRTAAIDNFLDTWHYAYDARNRLTTTSYPSFVSTTVYTYDGVGHKLTTTDQAGKVTTNTYDDAGRLASVTDALSHVTVYGYDASDNLTGITDANSHTTSFQYDSLNRRILRSLPLSQSETTAYDVVGNISAHTDFNGKTTTFTYDTLNRLLSKIPDASLSQPTITFTYTPTSQRATMVDASGTTTYSYDNRDRLTSKATPQGTLSYTYDPHSNLSTIASSNTNGASAAYTYNAVNQLATVVDNRLLAQGAASGTTSYGYSSVDLLNIYTYPNGVATTVSYDSQYRLTQILSKKGSPTLAQYTYTLGSAGNRTNVLEANSRNTAYGYDDVYKLTSETVTADPGSHNGTVNYTSYDPVGNRLTMTSTLSGVPGGSFSYDNNDRLSGDTSDANGNTISSAGIANTYDFENHMLSHGAVTMVYDGDGNRVAETVGGSTTQYLVDTLNPTGYAQVMDELVSGAVTRTYTYGLQRISQNQKIGATQTASFYGYDGHGNVRFLTGTAGTVTDTYVYDAFGLPLTTTGTTPNNFLYSGEQFDSVLGMYYLWARYYNPATGRFLSLDPDEGDISAPVTLNKYVYTGDNPVNFVDPNGEAEIAEYDVLVAKNRGLGLQAHHIIPQRFARTLGAAYCTIAIELTPAFHQVLTNLWRGALPYGGDYTAAQIFAAAEEVYWGLPNIAEAANACKALALGL